MLLLIVTFLVGLLSSLIGLGGGLFLVPILLILKPEYSVLKLTTLSLLVILLNSLFLSGRFHLQKRVNWKLGFFYGFLSLPGILLGNYLADRAGKSSFEFYFGLLMLLLGTYILYKTFSKPHPSPKPLPFLGALRILVSTLGGVLSSFFGLGGGVLQMPWFIYGERLEVRTSAATTQVIIVLVTGSTILIRMLYGVFDVDWGWVFTLTPAIFLGGQVGASISRFVNDKIVTLIFSVILFFVASRFLI